MVYIHADFVYNIILSVHTLKYSAGIAQFLASCMYLSGKLKQHCIELSRRVKKKLWNTWPDILIVLVVIVTTVTLVM